eukprot:m.247534 g.247534  ORF g.247534 m.247534 type:complete len:1277 (-) comp16127_c0_seq4:3193-7023(-)
MYHERSYFFLVFQSSTEDEAIQVVNVMAATLGARLQVVRSDQQAGSNKIPSPKNSPELKRGTARSSRKSSGSPGKGGLGTPPTSRANSDQPCYESEPTPHGCVLSVEFLFEREATKIHKILGKKSQLDAKIDTAIQQQKAAENKEEFKGQPVLVCIENGIFSVLRTQGENRSSDCIYSTSLESVFHAAASSNYFGVVVGDIVNEVYAVLVFRCAQQEEFEAEKLCVSMLHHRMEAPDGLAMIKKQEERQQASPSPILLEEGISNCHLLGFRDFAILSKEVIQHCARLPTITASNKRSFRSKGVLKPVGGALYLKCADGLEICAIPKVSLVVCCMASKTACCLVWLVTGNECEEYEEGNYVINEKGYVCTILEMNSNDEACKLATTISGIARQLAWQEFQNISSANDDVGRIYNSIKKLQDGSNLSVYESFQQSFIPLALRMIVERHVEEISSCSDSPSLKDMVTLSTIVQHVVRATESVSRDSLGFVLHPQIVSYWKAFQEEESAMASQIQMEWATCVASIPPIAGLKSQLYQLAETFCWRGIPDGRRCDVWITACSSSTVKPDSVELKNIFAKNLALRHNIPEEERRQIGKDIPRTYSNIHEQFSSLSNNSYSDSLRNILEAYSASDGGLCYWQGMSYVAGFCILVMRGTPESFCVYAGMVDQVLRDVYGERGPQAEIAILDETLLEYLPQLSDHLRELGAPTQLFSTEWFMCAFATFFPSSTTVRIWDCLFLYLLGARHKPSPEHSKIESLSVCGINVLHMIAIGFLDLHEEELLCTNDISEFSERLVQLGQLQFDHEALIQAALNVGSRGKSSGLAPWSADFSWSGYIERKRMRIMREMELEAGRAKKLMQLQEIFDEHAAGGRYIGLNAFIAIVNRMAAGSNEEVPSNLVDEAGLHFMNADTDGEGRLRYPQFLSVCQSLPFVCRLIELGTIDSSSIEDFKQFFLTFAEKGSQGLDRDQMFEFVRAIHNLSKGNRKGSRDSSQSNASNSSRGGGSKALLTRSKTSIGMVGTNKASRTSTGSNSGRKGKLRRTTSSPHVSTSLKNPIRVESNLVFDLAARVQDNGGGSSAGHKKVVSWESLLRLAGHVPVIAKGIQTIRSMRNNNVPTRIVSDDVEDTNYPTTPSFDLNMQNGNPLFMGTNINMSAKITEAKVVKSGKRMKRGRVDFVINLKREFQDQREIVRSDNAFRSLHDKLLKLAESDQLPESDAKALSDLFVNSRVLSSSASPAAITRCKHQRQEFLDVILCFQSPLAQELVSNFFLLSDDDDQTDTF